MGGMTSLLPRRTRAGAGAAVVAMLVVLSLAACTSTTSPPPQGGAAGTTTSAAPPPASCSLSAKGVPSCGILWGVATKPPTVAGVKAVEQKVGRNFDFVYRYHDLDATVPDASERAQVAAGQLLHIAIATRRFGEGGAIPGGWAELAAGKYDTTLLAQAKGIASLKVPTYVTLDQEANQKAKIGVLGTGADFQAAWRHLHNLYAQANATNVVWVWVMTGSPTNLDSAAQLWPGNDVVDWISWNVYNASGCQSNAISPSAYVSFEARMKVFYDFVHQRGPSIGMDPQKPMMISETGSAKYPGDPQRTADWYGSIPSVLSKYPQIRAVGLWQSIDGGCDYTFSTLPEALNSVKGIMADPHLDAGTAVETVRPGSPAPAPSVSDVTP